LSFFVFFCLFVCFIQIHTNTQIYKDLILHKELDGIKLPPKSLFILTHCGEESGTLGRVIVTDCLTSSIHGDNKLSLELATKDTEVSAKTLVRSFVQNVAGSGSRKRRWNLIKTRVGRSACVDTKKKRRSNSTARRWHQKGGLARRQRVSREELCVGGKSPRVAVQDELKVNFRFGVKGGTAVKAETPWVHAVKARVPVHVTVGVDIPDLNIFIAEEVKLRFRATRDTAHEPRSFARSAVVDDLLRSDVERRHVAG
jgi:hypothetical protein